MRDLRHVFLGMAIATVTGLAIGGAFKPTLRELTDLDGPQMLVGVSGVRSPPGLQQNASWTSYAGHVPDYVIGADWIQPEYPTEMAPAEPEPAPAKVVHEDAPVRLAVAPVKHEDEPAPPPTYPSMGGDILAGLSDGYPPTPPEDAPAEPPPA